MKKRYIFLYLILFICLAQFSLEASWTLYSYEYKIPTPHKDYKVIIHTSITSPTLSYYNSITIKIHKDNNFLYNLHIAKSNSMSRFGYFKGFTWHKNKPLLALSFSKDAWYYNKIIIVDILNKKYKIYKKDKDSLPKWTKMKYINWTPEFHQDDCKRDTKSWGEHLSLKYKKGTGKIWTLEDKRYLKGIYYYTNGKLKKAIKEWEKILKDEPNHKRAIQMIKDAKYLLKQKEKEKENEKK